MWKLIQSLFGEYRLALSLGGRVGCLSSIIRKSLSRGVAVFFYLGIFFLMVRACLDMMVSGREGPTDLVAGMAHVSIVLFLIQLIAAGTRRESGHPKNLIVAFYGGNSRHAANHMVATILGTALALSLEIGLLFSLGMEWALPANVSPLKWMLAMLLVVGVNCVGVMALSSLVSVRIVWWILMGYLFCGLIGFFGERQGVIQGDLLFQSGKWLAEILPQSRLEQSLWAEMLGGSSSWMNWIPAIAVSLTLPFWIRRQLRQYDLYEDEWDSADLDFEDDEYLEEAESSSDDLGLLNQIGTESDPGIPPSARIRDPQIFLQWFDRRERVLQQYLEGPCFAFLRGIYWSPLILIILCIYRIALDTGWLPFWELAVIGLPVLAIIPFLSLAISGVTHINTMAGRAVPLEDLFPLGFGERVLTRLKVGIIQMSLGLPVLACALALAPLQELGVDGIYLRCFGAYLSWMGLLPVGAVIAKQSGYRLTGRRWGFVLGIGNCGFVFSLIVIFLGTLISAFFEPWLLVVFLPLSWGIAGLCWLLFKKAVDFGFYEMRLRPNRA